MILQEERITITLADTLAFYSHDPQLSKGHFRLDETAIEGWYDGVSMRRSDEIRPNAWGDFDTAGTLASRIVALSGTAVARNRIELQEMRDTFTSVLINGDFQKMWVDTTTTDPRYMEVGLNGAPQWSRKTDTFAAFKIDLYAPDPRIYGELRPYTIPGTGFDGGMDYPITYDLYYGVNTTSEIQTIQNNGNADSWPIITVTGEMPDGFRITDNIRNYIEYRGPVTSSSPVVLDFKKGTARQRGQDRTTNIIRRDWFPIKPKSSIYPKLTYNNTGQGWMQVLAQDTWI